MTSFRYYYDLHGIVTIGSDTALPELLYFLQPEGVGDGAVPDMSIKVGRVGRARIRTRMVRSADGRSIRWEEHFGRGSANFAIHFGSQIQVTASRALARSPHVLYTNVVEALLRFVFVERGYMLLHAACMDVDGRGVMLSARTDTGKTGTVLKLLRTSEGRFLSDDMTIVDSAGNARCFPKPLTISEHTLRAVDAGDLSRREWAKLRFQSRLHSKEGRGFAMKLAEHNVPIMTINGWTQRIIPPPKYRSSGWWPASSPLPPRSTSSTSSSAACRTTAWCPSRRRSWSCWRTPRTPTASLPTGISAEALTVAGLSYDELRERERLILVSAMESVQIHRLGSDDFTLGGADLRGRGSRPSANRAEGAVRQSHEHLPEQPGLLRRGQPERARSGSAVGVRRLSSTRFFRRGKQCHW